MPHPAALDGNPERTFLDQLTDLGRDAVAPVDPLPQGLLHVGGADRGCTSQACPVACLADNVRYGSEFDGQLALMGGFPRAEADHVSHGRGIEGGQLLSPHLLGDEARVGPVALGITVSFGVEVGPHLEQLAEVVVQVLHQVIQLGRAEHDQFGVDGDRLWLQGRGGQQRKWFVDVGEQLTRFDRPLELLPDQRFSQGIFEVKDKITATGPEQAARLDASKVGAHPAEEIDVVLDGAKQVLVGGGDLDDNRRALGVGVVGDHVDSILQPGILVFHRRAQGGGQVGGFLLPIFLETIEVLQHVPLDPIEPGGQLLARVLALDAGDQRVDDAASEGANDLPDLLAELARQVLLLGEDFRSQLPELHLSAFDVRPLR